MAFMKKRRVVKYDGRYLLLRIDGQVKLLGEINTRQGGLTQAQKLKAVASTGEWVEV